MSFAQRVGKWVWGRVVCSSQQSRTSVGVGARRDGNEMDETCSAALCSMLGRS